MVGPLLPRFPFWNILDASNDAQGGGKVDIRELQSLVEVLEKGSISAAAAALGISQPAVSKHIAKLERELGIVLFVRGQKCSNLTAEGQVLYKFARKTVSQLADIRRDFANRGEDVSGLVRISASSIPGNYILPGLLVVFRALFPGIEVEVHTSDSREAIEKLVTREADIAMTGQGRHASGFTSVPFVQDELVLMVSLGHRLAKRKSVRLEELESLDLVARVTGSSTARIWEDAYKSATGKTKHASIKFNSVAAVIEAVKSGAEGTIISRLAASDIPGCTLIPFSTPLVRVFSITYGTLSTRAMDELVNFLEERRSCTDE